MEGEGGYGGGGGGEGNNYYGGGGGGGGGYRGGGYGGGGYRGRGGGRGGGGGRNYYSQGGGGGGGYRRNSRGQNYKNNFYQLQQRHQHQHQQKDPREEWRQQLQSAFGLVGDFSKRVENSKPLHENIKSMVTLMAGQSLLSGSRSSGDTEVNILGLMVKAAGELGMQAPIYGLLTALASTQPDAATFADDVVDGVMKALREALAAGALTKVKLYLRFFGELSNCGIVLASDLGGLLESLLASHISAPGDEVGTPCKDLIAYTVMATLPWCGSILHRDWQEGLADLMQNLKTYMGQRSESRPLRFCSLRSLLIFPAEDDEEEEGDSESPPDSLEVMWEVVWTMHKESWSEESEAQSIPRPWRQVGEDLKQVRSVPLQGPLDRIGSEDRSLEPVALILSGGGPKKAISFSDSLSYCYAMTISCEVELFDEDSIAGASTVGSLPLKERVILREYIRDALLTLQPSVKDDGSRVGSYKVTAEQLLSISKLAPVGCEAHYLVIELVLQAITCLPLPPHIGPYLSRVVAELCREAPDSVPVALSTCTGTFFHEIMGMDVQAIRQLSSWFAHHLKDTKFSWPFWSHWFHLAQKPALHPQRMFLTFVIHHLSKLTTTSKLRSSIPEEILSLVLPAAGRGDADEEGEGERNDREVKGPAVLSEFASSLSAADGGEAPTGTETDMDTGSLAERMKAGEDLDAISPLVTNGSGEVLYAALHAAESSPSALHGYVQKYSVLMRSTDPSGETSLVELIRRVWASDAAMCIAAVDSLLQYSLLSPASLSEWLFAQEKDAAWLADPVSWDLLSLAVSSAVQRREDSSKTMKDLSARAMADIPVDPFEEEEARSRVAVAEEELRLLFTSLTAKAVPLVANVSGADTLVPQSLLRWVVRSVLIHCAGISQDLLREALDSPSPAVRDVVTCVLDNK